MTKQTFEWTKGITVTQRSDDWHACVTGDPAQWDCGKSPTEAVNSLVTSHAEQFPGLRSLLAERDAVLAQLQDCADWLARSARTDDREMAEDARAAIALATGKEGV